MPFQACGGLLKGAQAVWVLSLVHKHSFERVLVRRDREQETQRAHHEACKFCIPTYREQEVTSHNILSVLGMITD